jgi:ATP-binding cassette, subfamily G (WHITE), member 2, PDR
MTSEDNPLDFNRPFRLLPTLEEHHESPEWRDERKEDDHREDYGLKTGDHRFYGDEISLFSDNLTLDWKKEVGNEAAVDAEIGRLARRLVRHQDSTAVDMKGTSNARHVLNIENDSCLDPYSPKFDPRCWMRFLFGSNLDHTTSSDPRITSVALKNLQVYGRRRLAENLASARDFSGKVTSILTRLVGSSTSHDLHILREFDGLLKEGEMLLVLGRSGR